MKKQKYWKAIKKSSDGTIVFVEAQGEVVDVTDNYGYTVKVAFEYERPYWRATLYESGLKCDPYRDVAEYPHRSNQYKSKDELIENIKEIDFKKYIKGNKFLENMTRQLAEFKANMN